MTPDDKVDADIAGGLAAPGARRAGGRNPFDRRHPRGSGWKRALELLAAAERLLEADGSERMTIRRIAADVGVTAALLYSYFPSRAALLEALCRMHLEALLQQMTRLGEATAQTARRRRLAAYFAFARAKPEIYRLAFAPLAATSAHKEFEAGGASAEARAVWALLSAGLAPPATASGRARNVEETPWLAGAAHGIALVLTSAESGGSGTEDLAEHLATMAEASYPEAGAPAAGLTPR